MFKSADHNTFGAYVREVLATFAKMWFWMLFIITVFKLVGLAMIDFTTNAPLLGAFPNYWLHSQHLTLGQALASSSPAVVMGVLGAVFFAPFVVEEFLFRALPWWVVKDDKGGAKPGGWLVILAGSFVLFGLAHGNGYFSVMLQGVSGLLLAQLWFRNGPSPTASYFSAASAHSLYNISVVIIVWFSGS